MSPPIIKPMKKIEITTQCSIKTKEPESDKRVNFEDWSFVNAELDFD